MTYDTEMSEIERAALAEDLDGADWPSPAADIRDGLSPESVVSRLNKVAVEDGEDTLGAVGIIEAHIRKIRDGSMPLYRAVVEFRVETEGRAGAFVGTFGAAKDKQWEDPPLVECVSVEEVDDQ
jgi:hypothetical protein